MSRPLECTVRYRFRGEMTAAIFPVPATGSTYTRRDACLALEAFMEHWDTPPALYQFCFHHIHPAGDRLPEAA